MSAPGMAPAPPASRQPPGGSRTPRLTIAQRLALSFGLLLLLLVVAVGIALDRLGAINAMVTRVVGQDWRNTVLANDVIDLTNAQIGDTFLLFHVGDPHPLTERIAARVITIDALLDELDARLADAESRALLAEIRVRRERYVDSFSDVARLLEAGLRDQASRQLVGEAAPALDTLRAAIAALIQLQGSILRDTGAASLAAFESTRDRLLAFLAAAILAALVLSAWIIRSVTRPLGCEPDEARALVERIAGGDLGGELPPTDGQADTLLGSMQVMQRNLTRLIEDRSAAEARLRESQQRFQGLVETLRDQVWEVDTAWRYTYISPQCGEILGYAADELLGRSLFELMSTDEAARVTSIVDAAGARRDAIVALETVHLHRNGRRVVLERSGRPFFDEHGRLRGYRGLDRDVTERKEAEAARLAKALRLRDALVREVHHRIKNNLQTVMGLLRREAAKAPAARPAIETAMAQVHTVAVVHGLYCKSAHQSTRLGELLPAVIANVQELTGTTIACAGPATLYDGLHLRESETVALALILNELLTNAVKHSAGAPPAAPRVALSRAGTRAQIRIVNPGQLPEGFAFDSGRGLSTGLGLVHALMPAQGMTINFGQHGAEVAAEIELGPPVLDAGGPAPAPAHADTQLADAVC